MDRLEATSSRHLLFRNAQANVGVHDSAKKATTVDRLSQQYVLSRRNAVAIALDLDDAKFRPGCARSTWHAETVGVLHQTMEKISPHHADAT